MFSRPRRVREIRIHHPVLVGTPLSFKQRREVTVPPPVLPELGIGEKRSVGLLLLLLQERGKRRLEGHHTQLLPHVWGWTLRWRLDRKVGGKLIPFERLLQPRLNMGRRERILLFARQRTEFVPGRGLGEMLTTPLGLDPRIVVARGRHP